MDAGVPGQVDGVYLTGSAVLGDFRPNRSDIDLLVVTTRPGHGPAAEVFAAADAPTAADLVDAVITDAGS